MQTALGTGDITKIGIGVIVVLIILGVIAGLLITAIIGRVLILVVVVALGIVVWQQRTSVEDKIDSCKLDATFFGIHLDAPDSIKQACRDHSGA